MRTTSTSALACLCLMLALAGPAFAGDQDEEPPVGSPADAECESILNRSAFLRGYLQGYASGFEVADEDIHMYRSATDIRKHTEYKRASLGFSGLPEDQEEFKEGFRHGMRAGYADSYEGRHFRAAEALHRISAGAQAKDARSFNAGLRSGYADGVKRGLADAKVSDARLPNITCGDPSLSCEGYERGFRLGYSDGFTNQAPRGTRSILARDRARP